MPDANECWDAVQGRRPEADGCFVYAVCTTGIYCRPVCPSRQARRENVSFYPDWQAAEAAGFRPCRRCHPRGKSPAADLVARLCQLIDLADAPPSLTELASRAGYSPFHLHRVFKAQTGLTPRQYAAGRRAERVRAELASGAAVTQAIYGAGYNAPSRFYADAPADLGMAPSRAVRGGAGEHIAYAWARIDLGTVLAARTDRGVCAIALGDDAAALIIDLHGRFPGAEITEEPGLGGMLADICAAIVGERPGQDLPLDLRGTIFQQKVWRALQAIPPGATETYAGLARRIGAPTAARAVGTACAANPVAVVVPCHRVVQGSGALAGYRWGLARKAALLAREAAQRPNDGPSTGAPIAPVSRKSR